jgi:UDP-N-acetylglucosamine 4,6-dehydratase
MFQSETFLITGGAGSLGTELVKALLATDAKSIRVLDHDEYGLACLKRSIVPDQQHRLRLLLGNIRDADRVRLAMQGSDIVIHAAALKNMEISEYNPIEACLTNIHGTSILVEAAFATRPEKFIFVSSDKAVHFTSLYGSTKFTGEKIALWANKVQDHTKFSVVRPPNYLVSRGNVFEVWDEEQDQGKPLSITDERMERFFIGTDVVAKKILSLADTMEGGEIYIPKGISRRIVDLAKEKNPSAEIKIIGVRPGEKMSERLYTEEEEKRLQDLGDFYKIPAA